MYKIPFMCDNIFACQWQTNTLPCVHLPHVCDCVMLPSVSWWLPAEV